MAVWNFRGDVATRRRIRSYCRGTEWGTEQAGGGSFLMAKRLKAMGMPVILSCWFPLHGPLTEVLQVMPVKVVSLLIVWIAGKRRRFINPWQIICCMPNGIMVLSSPCSRSMNRIWVLMSFTRRRSMPISLRSLELIWQS